MAIMARLHDGRKKCQVSQDVRVARDKRWPARRRLWLVAPYKGKDELVMKAAGK
jgi:hypothetical protein